MTATRGGAERIAGALAEARAAIDAVLVSAADGRPAAERLQGLAETLEAVTSRLERVEDETAEPALA